MENFVDKIKLGQMLYNLQMGGLKVPLESDLSLQNEFETLNEKWARKVFDLNRELFKDIEEQEFIKRIIYG